MKKSNKAFLDKIKTLTFGTGAAQNKPPALPETITGPDGAQMECIAKGWIFGPRQSVASRNSKDQNDNSFPA